MERTLEKTRQTQYERPRTSQQDDQDKMIINNKMIKMMNNMTKMINKIMNKTRCLR